MAAPVALWLALAALAHSQSVEYIDAVTKACYDRLMSDAGCCRDRELASGVLSAPVRRAGVEWTCTPPADGGLCLDTRTGLRGMGKLWWPRGADCSAPRVLYIHGGGWRHYGPTQASYDVLASKLASLTGAVVLVPDYPLVPIGNYHKIQHTLLGEWQWLAEHGAGAQDCSAEPQPPLFVGGDSAGAGTGLSLLLRLLEEPEIPRAAGFFGFSPWTNLACDSPTYYSSAYAAVDDVDWTMAYVGDILNRGPPRNNSLLLREAAKAYVAGDEALLSDRAASPFHATDAQLARLPPLYFAVSGTEARLGDAVIVASRASQQGVLVAQDIFDGMWHTFPMYSEGCGSGRELWQGRVALQHTGDFVRQVSQLARSRSELPTSMRSGSSGPPHTAVHYPYPTGKEPWVEVQPLVLAASARSPAAPGPGSAAGTEEAEALLQGGAGAEPELPPAPYRVLSSEATCAPGAIAGAYVTGAVGGVLAVLLGLATWWYCLARDAQGTQKALYQLLANGLGGDGYHCNGDGDASCRQLSVQLGDPAKDLCQIEKPSNAGIDRYLRERRFAINEAAKGRGGDLVRRRGRIVCIVCAFDYDEYGADTASGLCRLASTQDGRCFASLAKASGAEVHEFYDRDLPGSRGFPRRDVILSEIKKAGQSLGPSDTFVLLFAGHGRQCARGSEVYDELCFVEPDGTYRPLRADDLARLLLQDFRQETRVLLITDRCQSGAACSLCRADLGERPICHMAAVRERPQVSGPDSAGALVSAITEAVEALAMAGELEFSITQLHNRCLGLLRRIEGQDLQFECSPDLDPDTFAWPVVPPSGWASRGLPLAASGTAALLPGPAPTAPPAGRRVPPLKQRM